MAALAAEAAEEEPRASMIAAPRLPTPGRNSSSTHSMSSTTSTARSPRTCAWNRSGYIVGEWLPHTPICVMSVTGAATLFASCAIARLWSSRIIDVKRSGGISRALFIAMRQLVLAGLPTTSTLTSGAARSASAFPCTVKILPFSPSSSARSIPLVRGREPTSRATLTPSNAWCGSSCSSMELTRGNAQSTSSIATPSSAPIAWGISSKLRVSC